jgi:hypothetical protein
MKMLVKLLFCLCLVVPVYGQTFAGAGIASTATKDGHKIGPYIEGQLDFGGVKANDTNLGTAEIYAVLYSNPSSRFNVAFRPAYFDEWTVKPFVAVGGEWTNLAGQDEWHSTLTLGAKLPKGFQGRFTRLHLNPQGYRLGADWTKHVSENIGVRFSSDFTVNRHAKDVHVISLGLVHY